MARPKCGAGDDCLEFLGAYFIVSRCKEPLHRAGFRGHLECLRVAHEGGCPWHETVSLTVSERGHLECLRYAHENGCPWDEVTCMGASLYGRGECLRYAHENGCPWDSRTTEWASARGHVECLRYAHENGCPWDERVCILASQNGRLDCLRYALDSGCPVPDFMKVDVHPTVVPYLHHRGIRLAHSVLRDHLREHIRRAKTLLRCAVVLLGSYFGACARVYSPDGVGYREAESSFRSHAGTINKGTVDHRLSRTGTIGHTSVPSGGH